MQVMKRIIITLAISLVVFSVVKASNRSESQDTITSTGSFLNMRINQEATAHLRDLLQQQKDLNAQLDAAKNNLGANVEGASAHALEQYNIHQDSICLDLRSQIVDVELQISEITGNK